jgi:16S rRNA processing protein RimM
MNKYIAVGRVVRPHGVRGALLIAAISDLIHDLRPEREVFLGPNHTREEVVFLRPHRGKFLLSLAGLGDRNQAEHFRGQEISITMEQVGSLPEDTYYHWQIVGMKVVTVEGEALGSVVRILVTGANDVYVVEDEDGEEILIPAIDSVVKRIDVEGGRIEVELLAGLKS